MIERIEHSSVDGGDGLLAIILRGCAFPLGVRFVTEKDDPLQVGCLSHLAGKIIEAHIHPARERVVSLTQEVICIRKGRIRVDFYCSAGEKLDDKELSAGDTLIHFRGGHGFEVLDDAEMLEIKLGPYDPVKDKVRFHAAV